MLQRNEYVMLVSMNFTRAFDTIRHQTLMEKMAVIDLPDHIHNWMAAYFHQRGYVTKILDVISIIALITASIIQGFGGGPVLVCCCGFWPTPHPHGKLSDEICGRHIFTCCVQQY